MSNSFDDMSVVESAPADAVVLRMDGELRLDEAGALCDKLRAALEAGRDMRLDLEDVTEIDLASLQVLASARRSFEARGRRFEISGTLWRQAAVSAGLQVD
jgi:anti-anti-sigma factor